MRGGGGGDNRSALPAEGIPTLSSRTNTHVAFDMGLQCVTHCVVHSHAREAEMEVDMASIVKLITTDKRAFHSSACHLTTLFFSSPSRRIYFCKTRFDTRPSPKKTRPPQGSSIETVLRAYIHTIRTKPIDATLPPPHRRVHVAVHRDAAIARPVDDDRHNVQRRKWQWFVV